jgi:hypothetical protein
LLGDLEKAWHHLGGDEARRAFQAIWILATSAESAVAKARKELQPIQPVDGKQIAQFIRDLDSDQFAVREKAEGELKKAGDQAWPALRKAITAPGSPERKARARRLLDLQFNPRSERLRLLRCLELLEHINNAEARSLLQTLAQGAPQAWLTQEAKRMLARMQAND